MNNPTTTVSLSVISFFTFWMFWTLDGVSGRDMNDVMVEYWDAKVTQENTNGQ